MTTPIGRLAVAQRWEEHEPGWGFRPDGWSIHTDTTQHRAYLTAHADTATSTPEHDHPDGESYEVVVTEQLSTKLAASEFGVRTFDRSSTPRPGDVVDAIPGGQDAADYLRRLRRLADDQP